MQIPTHLCWSYQESESDQSRQCIDGICWCEVQFQNVDCIFALLQPHSRTEQRMLRAYVPISAEQMSVDPYVPFDEGSQVEVGVACAGKIESAVHQLGIARPIVLLFVLALPIEEGSVVERNAVGLPLESSPVNRPEVQKALSIKTLQLTEVQVSHRLHKDPQHTRITVTPDGCFPDFELGPGDKSCEYAVDEQQGEIMSHQLELVGSLLGKDGLIDHDALMVHLEAIALEKVEMSQLDGSGEVGQEICLYCERDGWNANEGDWRRNGLFGHYSIFLKHFLCLEVHEADGALLIDRSPVVIGGDMWLKFLLCGVIGPCSEAKVRSAVDHIQTEGDIIAEEGLKVREESIQGNSLKDALPPKSKPSCIDLSAEYQPSLEELRIDQVVILGFVVAAAETERQAGVILPLPVLIGVLIVKIRRNVQRLPHVPQ